MNLCAHQRAMMTTIALAMTTIALAMTTIALAMTTIALAMTMIMSLILATMKTMPNSSHKLRATSAFQYTVW